MIYIVFPKFFQIFPKIKGKICLSILEKFPTSKDYTNNRASTIFKLAFNVSKGHFSQTQADKILELAKKSIGCFSSSDTIIIRQSAQLIKLLIEQKKSSLKE